MDKDTRERAQYAAAFREQATAVFEGLNELYEADRARERLVHDRHTVASKQQAGEVPTDESHARQVALYEAAWDAEQAIDERVESLLGTIRGLRAVGRKALGDFLVPGFLEAVGKVQDALGGEPNVRFRLARRSLARVWDWYVPLTVEVSGGVPVIPPITPDTVRKFKRKGVALNLLAALRDHGGQTASELSNLVDGDPDYHREVLADLKRDGYVTNDNPGYRLMPPGQAVIDHFRPE